MPAPGQKKHDSITRGLARFAREAGMQASIEPDTFSLLMQEFPKEVCSKLFPLNFSDLPRGVAQLITSYQGAAGAFTSAAKAQARRCAFFPFIVSEYRQ